MEQDVIDKLLDEIENTANMQLDLRLPESVKKAMADKVVELDEMVGEYT